MMDERLHSITGSAGDLWTSAEARETRIRELLRASAVNQGEKGSYADRQHLGSLLDWFTADVRAGLEALGYEFADLGQWPIRTSLKQINANGLTFPPRDIKIGVSRLRQSLARDNPDSAFRTWLQELAHARAPIPELYWIELENWTGYEEGLAEAVTLRTALEQAGMRPVLGPYLHYAHAYRLLAETLGVEADVLLKAIWRSPMGTVREDFTEVVDTLYFRQRGAELSLSQRAGLRSAGDELFAQGQTRRAVDVAAITKCWREALR